MSTINYNLVKNKYDQNDHVPTGGNTQPLSNHKAHLILMVNINSNLPDHVKVVKVLSSDSNTGYSYSVSESLNWLFSD